MAEQASPPRSRTRRSPSRRNRTVVSRSADHRELEQAPDRCDPLVHRRRRRTTPRPRSDHRARRRRRGRQPIQEVEHIHRRHRRQPQLLLVAEPQETQTVKRVRADRQRSKGPDLQMGQVPVRQLDIGRRDTHDPIAVLDSFDSHCQPPGRPAHTVSPAPTRRSRIIRKRACEGRQTDMRLFLLMRLLIASVGPFVTRARCQAQIWSCQRLRVSFPLVAGHLD